MDASPYQGLFYLSSGFTAFVVLAFGFRFLSLRDSQLTATSAAPSDDGSVWRDREHLRFVEIISETHDVKTFRMERVTTAPFPRFSAGQFLSFQIGDDPKSLRSYSIASSMLNLRIVSVAVKHLKDGHGSGWFHSRKPGDTVWAFPPGGHFSDAALANETRVFVAGGIGITPFLSMIQTAIDFGRPYRIILLYGMRTSRDLAFHAHLSLLATRHQNFEYHPLLSGNADTSWAGARGYITSEIIRQRIANWDNVHFFFCGPPAMTDGITRDLVTAGVPDAQIHSEKFASPKEFDPASIPHRDVDVTFMGRKIAYSGRKTILEALEEHGLELPFACRVGVCGTCKCAIKGGVHEITDAGLNPAERQRGLKLPCVAFPLENIELEHIS